jgi:hypothetical protein
MTTNTAPEVDAELLKEGDWVHFFVTMSLLRDGLLFSPPVITSYGSEFQLTAAMLSAYSYPERDSWLHKLGEPDRNGTVKAARGRWPENELRTPAGSPARQMERQEALEAIWEEFGSGHSKAKADALKELDHVYGEQRDSWSAQNAAWKERS